MSFKSRITIIAVASAGVIAAVGIGVFAAHIVASAASPHGPAGAQVYSIDQNMYSTASATDATSVDNRSQGMSMLDKAFEKLHA